MRQGSDEAEEGVAGCQDERQQATDGDGGGQGSRDGTGGSRGAGGYGAEVRRLRERARLTQEALSKEVRYDKAHISRIENGRAAGSSTLAQALDTYFECDGLLVALHEREVVRSGRKPPAPRNPEGDCPYRGLAPYTASWAHLFRGRSAAVDDLLAGLDRRGPDSGPYMVVAPSGAGKTSLLRAGLVASLAAGRLPGSADWPVVELTPGDRPLDRLAQSLAKAVDADPERALAAVRSSARACADLLAGADPKAGKRPAERPYRTLILIDQFEEAFAQCEDAEQRLAFFGLLCELSALRDASGDPAVLVVLGLRADFYGRCLEHPGLAAALRAAPFLLEPMTEAELRQAVTEPAEEAGLVVDDSLVEVLLHELGAFSTPWAREGGYAPGALPLLSHALRVTWMHREGNHLTTAAYRKSGGIRKALALSADQAYEALTPQRRRIAEHAFVRLGRRDDLHDTTRRRISRARLLDLLPGDETEAAAVLEVFVRERLLTIDAEPDGEVTVQIAHEALLGSWPRLRQWLTHDQLMGEVRHGLSEAAVQWQDNGRDKELLLVGGQLARAVVWAEENEDELGPLQREFLRVSRERARRRARRKRLRIQILALLVVLALALAALWVQSKGSANRAEQLRTSSTYAMRSSSLNQSEPTQAARLAVAAFTARDTDESRSALLSSAQPLWNDRVVPAGTPVSALTYAADGRTVAWGGDDGRIYQWHPARDPDAADARSRPRINGTSGQIDSLSYSRDGRQLAVGYDDGSVWLVSGTAPARPLLARHQNPDHGDTDLRVTFNSDGTRLAAAGVDGRVRMWRMPGADLLWEKTPTGKDVPGPVRALAFSPDGRSLAAGGGSDETDRSQSSRRVLLWDVDSGEVTARLPGHPKRSVRSLAFTADGRDLVGGSFDGTVRVWDVRRAQVRKTYVTHGDSVMAVAVGEDGTLVSGAQDNTAQIRDLHRPDAEPLTLTGHTGPVNAVALSPDGGTVVTGGEDRTLRVWTLADSPVSTADGPLTALARSPRDGGGYATGDAEGNVLLWDDRARSPRRSLPASAREVTDLAYDPKGDLLAVASADHGVTLWRVADGKRVREFDGHTREVLAVAFDRTGKRLVTGGWDSTLRVWDVSNGHEVAQRWATDLWGLALTTRGTPLLASSGQDNAVTLRTWPDLHVRRPSPRTSTDSVFDLAFSPEGTFLASAGRDHVVQIWDVRERRTVARLYGHTAPVLRVSFSKDGNRLVSAGRDGSVRVWQRKGSRWELYAALRGPTGQVRGAVFAPDGDSVLSANEDGTLRRWDLDPEGALRRICSVVGPGERREWSALTSSDEDTRPCR
ncbi:helix-turn-helix domain-containing protein [Streptomyces sp. GESEQ-4]|uniref:nSTAND1 domain-containing NTPase n=1 Tax=Streptomyces sp. GESEQ-4 TaxID=2812655 RepID=UPI001B33BB02|nr:helix-turn-helix domain-containing protein [Streptomyces sp. GESEQ-4]